MEDKELVERLLAKDKGAERYFFETYREKLYKACVYFLGHQDPEAEDIVQEAFIVALRKLPEFEFRSTFHHWLFRICVFLCYHRIHKRRRHVVHLEEELEELSGAKSVEQERWKKEDGEKQRMIELVQQQRELMGDPCKSLLRLRDLEGQSYLAIAEVLKVPIGTVMSRLARCKESLKTLVIRALQGEGFHA